MKLADVQIKRIKPNIKPRKVSDGGGLFLWSRRPVERFGAGHIGMRGGPSS